MHILFIDLDEGLVKPQFLEHFLMFLFEWCTSFSCKIDIMYSHATKHTFDMGLMFLVQNLNSDLMLC